jgi:hypothetical protein
MNAFCGLDAHARISAASAVTTAASGAARTTRRSTSAGATSTSWGGQPNGKRLDFSDRELIALARLLRVHA